MYEIELISDGKSILMYKSNTLPQVNDMLTLEPNKLFIVKHRLLPTFDSNKIVLYGIIEN